MARSKYESKKRKKSSSDESSHKKKKRYDKDYKRKKSKHRRSSSISSSERDKKEKNRRHKDIRKKRDKSQEKHPKRETKKPKKSSKSSSPLIDAAEIERNRIAEETKNKATLEAEQKQLLQVTEEELKKRRERVLAWREQIKKDLPAIENEVPTKAWNLEDEIDEEEIEIKIEKQKKSPEVNDKADPLDLFMNELKESMENQKNVVKTIINEDEDEKGHVQTIVTAKQPEQKNDVEILEQFGDAAEYSSEEDVDDTPLSFISKKNTKVLPAVDHNKIYYRDFRKNFYIEVPEITKMTDADVAAYRVELENIQIKGRGCPKPIKKWVQTGVNSTILEILRKLNFVAPTPIQAQAIPAIMSGRDVIGIAKTGSGKTLAFLLPMFRHVLDQPSLEEGDGPIAIVLTPTRELAVQILKDCRKFAKYLEIHAISIYGGSVVSEQIAELRRGAEIAICTPGRFIDMLAANSGRITNCRRCTFLVLDEADRMFDMGFEPQVHKIMEQIRPDRQICLFTATFSMGMEALARKILNKPLEVIVGTRNKVCDDIKQYLVLLDYDNKFLKLLELLGMYSDAGSILIFVDRQESADELLKDLLTKGYPCMSIHGGRDQYDRDSTLNDFKHGYNNILIATSVAARGLDVKNIILVINYDCPNHGEDYVHRCGRTGRAGKKGTAITFITSRDAKYLKDIIAVIENTNCDIPQSVINLYKKFMAIDKNRRIKTSGFSGRGFKFDDRELLHSSESKKMIKWTFGWQDSGDEAEEEKRVLKKIEVDIDKAFSSRPRASNVKQIATVDKDRMELAQSIATKLNEKLKAVHNQNQEIYDQVVKPVVKPKPEVVSHNATMDIAKEVAGKLNMKLNEEAMKPSRTETTRKLTVGEVFFEEIDINDFPQLARQRITSKEALDAVAEMADCALTVRGTYCPAGKSIDFSDRRLHLLIEGNTEFKVQIAKADVKRIIKEECIKSDYAFIQPSSRYKIT